MSGWVVETTDQGTFDVTLDGRAVAYDEDTVEDAAMVVSRRGGNEFVLVEPDGYRTTHRC